MSAATKFVAKAIRNATNGFFAARKSSFRAIESLESRTLFAAGSIDSLFGSNGTVLRGIFSGGDDYGFAVAVQSDGKVLIAGRAGNGVGGGSDFAVARFNSNGSVDTTFGANGIVTTDLGSFADSAYAMVIQSDGKIVLAGETTGATTDFAVVRYNSDGSLDTAFGTGGKVITDLSGDTDQPAAIALDPSGKIIVAGSAWVAGLPQIAAVRYNVNGTLDSSFGSGGVAIAEYGAGYSKAAALTVLSDGSVVAAGSVADFNTGSVDFAAVKFSNAGSLLTSFGTNGWAIVDLGGDSESGAAVAQQADGKLVLAGSFYDTNSGVADFGLTRITATGQLDTSFGSGGVVLTDFAGDWDQATAVSVYGSRILAGGIASVGGTTVFALAQYTSSGALDSGFGTAGRSTVSIGQQATANALAVDSQCRIVVGGFALNNAGNYDLAVARFIGHNNIAPTGYAGGPYTVMSGGSVQLDGSGSSDSDGTLLAYQWDFNYDGSTFDVDATGATPTFSAASLVGPLDRTIALRVIDNDGAASVVVTTSLTVTPPPNVAPTANAGGPYNVASGGSVQLDGSGSSDSDGSVVTYQWDFNYDGGTFDVDATGMEPTFSAAGMVGPFARTIALRVIDNSGATSTIVTTTLSVAAPPNVAPTANAGGPYSADSGGSVQLDGSNSGDSDGSIVGYEWDFNYDGSAFDVDATGAKPTFSAAGLTGPLTRTIALRAIDNTGATSAIVTTTVTINPVVTPPPAPEPGTAVTQDDPDMPGKKILVIYGTSNDDVIRLQTVSNGLIDARINGIKLGRFACVSKIVAYGGGGNDFIDATHVNVPVELFGGDGNDLLMGSRMSDILVGGGGNDNLFGANGNDLIVGGKGQDNLHSHLGDDVMVSGSLTFEGDRHALESLLKNWNKSRQTLSKKVASLLDPSSVIDDKVKDKVHGTPAADYIVTGVGDKVDKLPKAKETRGKK